MQPEKPSPLERPRVDRLRQRLDRLLSGSAPSDPLYLSNRTWAQKLKAPALIAVPFLILGALAMVGATDIFHFTKVGPYDRPVTEAQPAPAIDQIPDQKLTPTDLDIVNMRISKDENPPVVTGVVRNNTNQKIDSAEVVFDLADEQGSLLGSETTRVQNVAPHSNVTFRAPLKIANAWYVLAREVRSR